MICRYVDRKIAMILLIVFSGATYAQDEPQNYNPFFITEDNSSASPSTTQRFPGERACGSGATSWGGNDFLEVPGIYWAHIRSYCHNGLEIAIWTDFTPSLFGSNPQAKLQGREILNTDGAHSIDMDGSREIRGLVEANAIVEYRFSVDPSGDGRGYINGNEYNLQNGTLFLIATHGSEFDIRQVDYNLANLNSQDIELLATRLPEITSFFEEFHGNFQR